MHRTRLTPLLAVAALALTAGPAAAATPHVSFMRLAIRISATHAVKWHYQDAAYPDPARSWVAGQGTQTLTFADPQEVKYIASVARGSAPDGTRLTPLAMTPLRMPGPLQATLTRTGTWTPHDAPTCDREGGCGDSDLVLPLHHTQDCPPKAVDVTPSIDVEAVPASRRWRLVVPVEPITQSGLWANCPPDMDGATRPLVLAQPGNLAFAGAIARISRLHRGQSVTLRAGRRSGAKDGVASESCPELSGAGQQECATTRVTLQVRRLR
jgi:hypothetical protein